LRRLASEQVRTPERLFQATTLLLRLDIERLAASERELLRRLSPARASLATASPRRGPRPTVAASLARVRSCAAWGRCRAVAGDRGPGR
jgi:hypothetical protein